MESEIKKLIREAENWATFRFMVLMAFIAMMSICTFNVVVPKLNQIIKLLGGVK